MDETFVMNSYVTPLIISTVGIVCSTVAIAVYHCILLRFFIRPQRTQHRNNTTNTSWDKSEGVQEEILDKIPVFSISAQTSSGDNGIHLDQNVECSICLGQWEDGDMVRSLPSCNHVFHKSCIDAWFTDHANCPVCRSPISCDCESTFAFPNFGFRGALSLDSFGLLMVKDLELK
ncbi:unnamed protein product [Sphenostylis stenocarpa]|uniref:RING-type domain-containing protein n=1 Tax=Sphenostylis stenocarpa TaxID=92480 RepID=A0AA86VB33_9FABA|nr:unnamed protein product [Sphenostylis stenocarpa]